MSWPRSRSPEALLSDIRAEIYGRCDSEKKPYRISIGIGVDELDRNEPDAFAKCMKRADDKMYRNKKSVKRQGS